MISLHPASGLGKTGRPYTTGGMGAHPFESLLPPIYVSSRLPTSAIRSQEVWAAQSTLSPETVVGGGRSETESLMPPEEVTSQLPPDAVESEMPPEEVVSDEPGE